MTGYTKVYNKSTGNTIEASDFNTEFQAIDDAMNASTGHKHDGTTDEGAYVPMIYDAAGKDGIEIDATNHELDFNINVAGVKTRQVYLADGALVPNTDSDVDLGTTALRFKDAFVDSVTITNSATIAGAAVLGAGSIGVTVQGYDADTTKNDVANTFTAVQTFPNTGLHILDTNATHDLIVAPGSNLTSDRTLTVTTGDADRTLDISAGSVTFGAYANTINSVADEASFKAAVNLEPGVDVQAYDADIPTVAASQAEMEAGTEAAVRSMSPLRVAQAVVALGQSRWVHISTTNATSGSSISFTDLDLDVYDDYLVLFDNVDLASGTDIAMQLVVTDENSNTVTRTSWNYWNSYNDTKNIVDEFRSDSVSLSAVGIGVTDAAANSVPVCLVSTTCKDAIKSLVYTLSSSTFAAGKVVLYGR